MNRFLVLFLGATLVTTTALATPVKVSATQAIRIALVDAEGRQTESGAIEHAFGPRFSEAAARIYGADTRVELVRVDAGNAARGLRRGTYDAAMVFDPRLPTVVRRTGFHVLRAMPVGDRADGTVYLILRQEQPALDELLANAFNVALHHAEVQRTLKERRAGVTLAIR